MPQITLTTDINAPVERCYYLSLSIDLHQRSATGTGEQAVGGVTSGIIKQGETVTWRAKHFGIWQHLTTIISEATVPTYFCDEMVKGAFKSIRHEHHFKEHNGGCLMTDYFNYESPLGILGNLFNSLILTSYMTRFLLKRNSVIKETAESDAWKQLLLPQGV